MRLEKEQIRNFVEPVVKSVLDVPGFEGMDVDMLVAQWSSMIEAGHGVAYGVEVDNQPAGFLLGVYFVSALSGEKEASEFLWIVAPQYRKKGVALILLKEFERDAAKNGCASSLVGNSAFFKTENLGRLYRCLGYGSEPVLQTFKKRL